MGVISCGTTMLDAGEFQGIDVLSWDTTAKTASFTAVAGNGYFVNTTSGAITVTLPSSPSAGDQVAVQDYAGTWADNNVTIARNGSNIAGAALDATLKNPNESIVLIYVDGTRGWQTIIDSTQSVTGVNFVTATGGTVSTCGDYKIHTFTGPGSFNVTCAGNPSGSTNIDYMVVAGGGGTGYGGAGGGGFRESSGAASGCYTTSPLGSGVSPVPVSVQGYPITVGAGGAEGPSGVYHGGGSSGSNSVFSTITSTGGGGGGSYQCRSPGPNAGKTGGSGGGAGFDASSPVGGVGNTPPVSPPQGQPGGGAPAGGAQTAGGGGGATQAGQTQPAGIPKTGGYGGDGAGTAINPAAGTPGPSPSLKYFAGGGGGGANTDPGGVPPAPGGDGGGGDAPGVVFAPGEDGTANTGGGGGGGDANGPTGANGGSGIVVIRYKYR